MTESTPCRRGRGEDAIYFDAAKYQYVGAVSIGFGPDGKRLRRKVTGRTKQGRAGHAQGAANCWMRTPGSRICRARSSVCNRNCATGKAMSIVSSKRSWCPALFRPAPAAVTTERSALSSTWQVLLILVGAMSGHFLRCLVSLSPASYCRVIRESLP